ncbi:MAG TPA: helix-turn-helix transcriptional regulator [Fontimonas sp.]
MPRHRRPQLRNVLAANVRRERLKRDWSQEALGGKAGVTQTYISQLESAHYAASVDVVEALAKAFGLDPIALLSKSTGD